MNGKTSKKSKAYKTAAIFYAIGGFVFIISSVVGGEVGAFLPIGIAFIVLSIAFWQHSKKLTDS